MTYKENSNGFLNNSNMFCQPPVVSKLLRNFDIEGNLTGLEDTNTYRLAADITTETLVEYYTGTTSIYWGEPSYFPLYPPVVRNENYIYYVYTNDTIINNRQLAVAEYNLDTQERIIVIVKTMEPDTSIHQVFTSYIDARKIFVMNEYSDDIDGINNGHVVDFESGTSTVVMGYNDSNTNEGSENANPIAVLTHKMANGDIWIYVIGWHYYFLPSSYHFTTGIWICYQNFTQNGDWHYDYIDCDYYEGGGDRDGYLYHTPQFIRDDYIVSMYTIFRGYDNPDNNGIIGFVFDMHNLVLSKSEIMFNHAVWEPCVFFSAPDASTEKLVFSAFEWQEPSPNGYADTVFIFDPKNLQFTRIFDSLNYGECYTVSDYLHAYFYDNISHKFYQAIPFTLKGTCAPNIDEPDYFLWDASIALDENGPSFWYLDYNSFLLTEFDMKGNIKTQIQTTFPTTNRSYSENPIHIGDSIIMVHGYSHSVGYTMYNEIRIYHYHK